MLLYFRFSFLKTLTIHSQEFFGKKSNLLLSFYAFFDLQFFLEIWVFWSFLLKVFKKCLEMCYWIAFKLQKTFFITFGTVSQPFSVKTVKKNIQNLLTVQQVWVLQGSYSVWNTWKSMEFNFLFSMSWIVWNSELQYGKVWIFGSFVEICWNWLKLKIRIKGIPQNYVVYSCIFI